MPLRVPAPSAPPPPRSRFASPRKSAPRLTGKEEFSSQLRQPLFDLPAFQDEKIFAALVRPSLFEALALAALDYHQHQQRHALGLDFSHKFASLLIPGEKYKNAPADLPDVIEHQPFELL